MMLPLPLAAVCNCAECCASGFKCESAREALFQMSFWFSKCRERATGGHFLLLLERMSRNGLNLGLETDTLSLLLICQWSKQVMLSSPISIKCENVFFPGKFKMRSNICWYHWIYHTAPLLLISSSII